MADALCGPSNSLQTFQKHTSVDRTLQQDRISSRQSPVEGFRSTPGRNAGMLDAEFEAFQAGQPIGNQFPELQHFPPGSDAVFFPSTSAHPQPPTWASDFQKLHINSPQPSHIPQPQFQPQAPQFSNVHSAWRQDFMQQQNQSSAQPDLYSQGFEGSICVIDGDLNSNTFSISGQQRSQLSDPALQGQSGIQEGNIMDDAAFERAFDAAHSQMWHVDDHPQEETVEVLAEQIPYAASAEEVPRIGSDRILDEAATEKQERESKNDADELARTAGQLLDNLKHDQSQKFQESNFLLLMRQLRDREVRVEGDKLVEASQSLHPGGQFYPNEVAQSLRDEHSIHSQKSREHNRMCNKLRLEIYIPDLHRKKLSLCYKLGRPKTHEPQLDTDVLDFQCKALSLRNTLPLSKDDESSRRQFWSLIDGPSPTEAIPTDAYTTGDLEREAASLTMEIRFLAQVYVTDCDGDMETLIPASLVDDSGEVRKGPFTNLPKHEMLENRQHNLRKLVLEQARHERARQKNVWKALQCIGLG